MIDFLPQITIVTARNLANRASELVTGLNLPQKICLVSDEKIWENCQKFFDKNFIENCEKILILENPKPDEKNLLKIKNSLGDCNLIIAVGSGIINDLCKYASFQTKIPYIIFPSATSMNGYLSRNASLVVQGYRKTLPATLPVAVFCDLEILKSAPIEMIKAGIGDSLCFYACWFDWKLSHLILGTKFDEKPFEILQEKMDFFIKNYTQFSLTDEEFLKYLIEILLLSGAGMTLAGGSYPASQAEHLIAHAFEMKYKENSHEILHGLQIATTVLTSVKLQEKLVAQDFVQVKINDFSYEKLAKFFDEKIADECEKEFLAKNNFDFVKINKALETNWARIREDLQKIILPTKNLEKIFQHFEIDISKNLGLSDEKYQNLIDIARYIRNRFTCLDIV